MIFKEFGDKNKPVIIFLHGGGLSWWSWKVQIAELKKDYHVIAVIMDGHGEAGDTTFVSIQKSAEKLIEYIQENFNGRIYALCGLSIGAQIAVEMLSLQNDVTEKAVIESALVYPMKTAVALSVPIYNLCYGLVKKKWYAKLQAKTLNVPEELFENYYKDSLKISKESLINITKSNGSYSVSHTLTETRADVLILVGEKEIPIMKKSAALLHETIPGSFLKVVEKSRHGEISLSYPEQYLELLKKLFEKNLSV